MLTFFVKGGTFCIDSCSDKCMYLNYIKCCELLLSPFWDLEESGCENFTCETSTWYEAAWHGRSVRWPLVSFLARSEASYLTATGKTRALKTCPKISGVQNFTRGNETNPKITFQWYRSIIRNHEPLKNHGSPIMILWEFWYFCNCKPRTSLLFYPFSALGHRRCSALCKRSNLGWSAPSRIKTFFSLCSRFVYSQELTIVTVKHGRPRELLY